jgi:hypothetical protein
VQKADKEQVVQLISRWRERSHLSIKQIVARIQAQGCDLSRSMFENRFIRFDQQPDIAPELTLAVIAAFTAGLTPAERCTPAEAIELAKLTRVPLDRFADMRRFFAADEFDRAFSQFVTLKEGNSQAEAKTGPTASLPTHFPGKAYHRLIGRSREFEQLLAALRERERKPVIAVVGLGGIGKTVLAQAAMEQCWREGIFDHIVWASAKTERFVGEGARQTGVSGYSFEQMLDDIGRQCDRADLAKLPPAEKRVAVKRFLLDRRVLVVMDNLETVPQSDAFVDELFEILGQSKLLLTSRHQVMFERAFTLDLSGLAEPEGVTFLREEGAERGIEVVARARLDDLHAMHQATGGAPLAMKLVVGQVSRLPLKQVLHNLKTANSAGPNYDFYRFIFKHSWDMLAVETQQVLVSLSVFDQANGSTAQALRQVSELASEPVQLALDQLILLSLVDALGDLAARRYTLHPLTHYFIMSDIVKKWSQPPDESRVPLA